MSSMFNSSLMRTVALAITALPAFSAAYRIVQITSDPTDHRWPSINNRGDIVWAQQVNGKWQIFKKSGPLTSSAPGVNINAPDGPNHNYRYPAISDIGDLVYLRDNNPRNNNGSDLQVVKQSRNGVETVLEFSSRNINVSLGIAAERTAGSHFGIASNGTTISYYHFTQTSAAPVRRFNVNGSPLKDSGGSIINFLGRDYPSINANGFYAYSDNTGVFLSPLSGASSPTRVDNPGDNGLAPSIADDGDDPEVVYIKNPQVANGEITSGLITSKQGTRAPIEVHRGSWASVNKDGVIAFEDIGADNVRHIYIAVPAFHLVDPVSDLISGTGLTTDLNKLATAGRVVEGVASDGVARLVIRIDATGFDSGELEILDELGRPVNNLDLAVWGSLESRTGGTPATRVKLTPEVSSTGQRVFLAVYRAPSQFVRSNSADGQLAVRFINLQARVTGGGQVALLSSRLKTVRPPVFLVHGIWATASVWDTFGELGTANNDTSKYYVARADYPSDRDFQTGATKVYSDLLETIKNFKNDKKIAAIQANVVAHGMAAPVVQTLAIRSTFLSDDSYPTYGIGPINRLISISGAHQGAALANYLVDNNCVTNLLTTGILLRPQSSQAPSAALVDLTTTSSAINAISAPTIRTPFVVHTLVGATGPPAIPLVEGFVNTVGSAFCMDLPRLDTKSLIGPGHNLFTSHSSQQGFPVAGPMTEGIPAAIIHSPPYNSAIGRPSDLNEPHVATRVLSLLDSANATEFIPLEGQQCSPPSQLSSIKPGSFVVVAPNAQCQVVGVKLGAVGWGGSNHAMTKDGSDSWTNDLFGAEGATPIGNPIWVDDEGDGTPEKDDPVAYTARSSPELTNVKLLVTGAETVSIPAKLRARTSEFSFAPVNLTLSGPVVTVPSLVTSSTIGSVVNNTTYVLTWSVSFDGGATYRDFATSRHRVFVTLGTPRGYYVNQAVTARRVSRATLIADGESAPAVIAAKMSEFNFHEVGFGPDFLNISQNHWQRLDLEGGSCDCISLALLVAKHLRIIGITATEGRAFPTGGVPPGNTDAGSAEVAQSISGEVVILKFSAGVPNNFEGFFEITDGGVRKAFTVAPPIGPILESGGAISGDRLKYSVIKTTLLHLQASGNQDARFGKQFWFRESDDSIFDPVPIPIP